jgi:hypothetical protein
MAPTRGINKLEQLSNFRTSPTSLQEETSFLAALAREPACLNVRVFPLLEQAAVEMDTRVGQREQGHYDEARPWVHPVLQTLVRGDRRDQAVLGRVGEVERARLPAEGFRLCRVC